MTEKILIGPSRKKKVTLKKQTSISRERNYQHILSKLEAEVEDREEVAITNRSLHKG